MTVDFTSRIAKFYPPEVSYPQQLPPAPTGVTPPSPLPFCTGDIGNGGFDFGQGVETLPHPIPPSLQQQPPDSPPRNGGGGDDDDGDDPDDWIFPLFPPMNSAQPLFPFVVQQHSTVRPAYPMYVLATVPFRSEGVPANLQVPGSPPPLCVAFWAFPVQHLASQVRQYFRPPGPFILSDLPVKDYSEKFFRKQGWVANSPVTEHWPVFQYSPAGQFLMCDPRGMDTPISDWRIVSIDPMLQEIEIAIYHCVEQSRMFWLHPTWLNANTMQPDTWEILRLQYEEAESSVPLVCASQNMFSGGLPDDC